MKNLVLISILFLLLTCGVSSKNQFGPWKTIEVGRYIFDFPAGFELKKGKGIDSYVGKIQDDSISFSFDYGYYSNDFELLSEEYQNEFKMFFIVDTVENQYRKIVYGNNPEKEITGIYLRDLESFNKSINSYLALSMETDKITKQQQEIVLKIFRTGRLKK